MSLWDIALENAKNKESSSSQQESHVLFIGAKTAGKTTLINRLLEKDESPKPTVALEYTFGRKSKSGHNSNKEVAHVWELGGGLSMTRLLDNVLDADNVLNCSVVLLVDLSQPAGIWATIEALTAAIEAGVGRVIASAPKESRLKEQLRQKQKERLQSVEADDAQLMSPSPLPLTIVGGKFDQFQEKIDHERKRVATQTLRFLAHSYSASLYYFSTVKQEQAAARLRAHLTQLAFGTGTSHHQDEVQADIGRPLILPAGRDSFAKIGQPPAEDSDYHRLSAKTPMDLWKHAFYQHFPEERQQFSGGRHPVPPDPTVDPNDPHKFDEPAVDRARAAKDEELDKYKRISDRKMRDLMQQAVNEGINVSLVRQLD